MIPKSGNRFSEQDHVQANLTPRDATDRANRRSERQPSCPRPRPLHSIVDGFGNFLETITAHWQAVIRHIHHFFAWPGSIRNAWGLEGPNPGPCKWAIATDEPRRQYPLHGDDLCGGDPRIAAAICLGAEHRDPRGRLVGLCASDPRRFGRAVRHVRHGARPDHHRSCQCAAVHRLRGDLDRRARVRRPSGRTGLSGDRRRASGCWSAACRCSPTPSIRAR